MKKIILLSTSALVASALAAGAAQAATTIAGNPAGAGTFTLTGNYGFYFGYASNSGAYHAYNNADVKTDGNIRFSYANTLDNGLTVTVGTQLNTSGDHSDNYDANSATIGSDVVGTLAAGQNYGLASSLNHSAGEVSSSQAGFNDSDIFKWLADPAYTLNNSEGIYNVDTVDTTYINDTRSNVVGYQTPSFFGATAFASYIPDYERGQAAGANKIFNNSSTLSLYEAGLTYDNTIEGWKIGGDAAYSGVVRRANAGGPAGTKDLNQYQVGASLGYAGITVAGGWHESDWIAADAGSQWSKAVVYDAGVGYATGPATIGLTWIHFDGFSGQGTNLDFAGISSTDGNGTQFMKRPHYDQVSLNGAYVIGTGVSVTGEVDYQGVRTGTTAVSGNQGYLAATGLTLAF